jgi:hypothetical protein
MRRPLATAPARGKSNPGRSRLRLVLVLITLAGGRADSGCSVTVHNHYRDSLLIDAYNGWDGICSDSILSFSVDGTCTLFAPFPTVCLRCT